MNGIELTSVEARVLGCLVEKELTTPDYYPLTMNALITACNQSSNRDPVVSYDESTVADGIDSLREKSLVRWVKEVRSRSPKYRHDLDVVPGLSVPERSLIAVLLLRGPQTTGELRTRTDRYHSFGSLDEVEAMLKDLAAREEPITQKLGRHPGQKEPRWRQLWSGDSEVAAAPPTAVAATPQPGEPTGPSLADQLAALTERVSRIERELGLE